MLNFIKKFGSRKLIVSFLFGIAVPICFNQLGLSETVVLASMAMGGCYLGVNAIVSKKEAG